MLDNHVTVKVSTDVPTSTVFSLAGRQSLVSQSWAAFRQAIKEPQDVIISREVHVRAASAESSKQRLGLGGLDCCSQQVHFVRSGFAR
jgi:hypothetical protein